MLTLPGRLSRIVRNHPYHPGQHMNVKSLGYVVIQSTDLERWRDFGTGVVGMMESPGMPTDGNLYLKMDDRPFRFAIQAGMAPRSGQIQPKSSATVPHSIMVP